MRADLASWSRCLCVVAHTQAFTVFSLGRRTTTCSVFPDLGRQNQSLGLRVLRSLASLIT